MATENNHRLLLGHNQHDWGLFCHDVFGNPINLSKLSSFTANHALILLFLVQMEKSEAYRKGSGASKKWDGGGPGGPGSGPYGGGPRGPPRGLDNVRGIDHSKSPLIFY